MLISAPIARGGGRWIVPALIAATILATGMVLAPAVRADPSPTLREAVAASRGGTSCPLKYNDLVARIAEVINKSTDNYLNHTAVRIPISDPLEGFKELGYPGTKGYLLQGAHPTEAKAIKGALLEGYDALSDCSYNEYGVSMLHNEATGNALAVVVLAGP